MPSSMIRSLIDLIIWLPIESLDSLFLIGVVIFLAHAPDFKVPSLILFLIIILSKSVLASPLTVLTGELMQVLIGAN